LGFRARGRGLCALVLRCLAGTARRGGAPPRQRRRPFRSGAGGHMTRLVAKLKTSRTAYKLEVKGKLALSYAVPQRLALRQLAPGVGQRELALHLELVGGARGLQLGDEPRHAPSSARPERATPLARRCTPSASRSCEAAKHQRT